MRKSKQLKAAKTKLVKSMAKQIQEGKKNPGTTVKFKYRFVTAVFSTKQTEEKVEFSVGVGFIKHFMIVCRRNFDQPKDFTEYFLRGMKIDLNRMWFFFIILILLMACLVITVLLAIFVGVLAWF